MKGFQCHRRLSERFSVSEAASCKFSGPITAEADYLKDF
jgi:hypothetical protein